MEELDMRDVTPDLKKFLLIGAEGTGKTNFIKTCPKPIYVFSFDKGYRTLAGEDGIKTGICLESDRTNPQAWKNFQTKFNQLQAGEKYTWGDGREEAYKTIAFDPLTFMSKALFDFVQFVNSNVDKKAGFSEWQIIKSRSEDVLNRAIAISEYVVCTGLIDSEKDDATGELFYVPAMLGSTRNEVGAWFDAVFYMEVDKTPIGERNYKMLTVGGRRHKAKIRVPSSIGAKILAAEVPNFKLLKEKVDREWDLYVQSRVGK